MTGTLLLPDGREAIVEEGEALDIGQLLLAVAKNTALMGRMLDIMVRLECGALKRADLKKDILETEAAVREYQERQGMPTAEEALAAVEAQQAAEHAPYEGKDPEQDNLPEALTAE
jgi:hypothetical protein